MNASRRRTTGPAVAVAVTLTVGMLAGCGDADRADPPPDGLVGSVVVGPRLDGTEEAEIRGVVDTTGRCVTVRMDGSATDNGFIWPNGTGWDSDRGVVLPDGRTLADGDPVAGAGGFHTIESDVLATDDLVSAIVDCGWDPTAATPWLQDAG